MKKIKKLELNALNRREMSDISGQGSYTDYWLCQPPCVGVNTSGGTHTPNPFPPKPTQPPTTQCGCGCSGCAYEDGGTGFTLGMMNANIDGVDCSFFAVV